MKTSPLLCFVFFFLPASAHTWRTFSVSDVSPWTPFTHVLQLDQYWLTWALGNPGAFCINLTSALHLEKNANCNRDLKTAKHRFARVCDVPGTTANLIPFEKIYKNLATPISPGEIRISEIKWDESNERGKDFILKKKKKKKSSKLHSLRSFRKNLV